MNVICVEQIIQDFLHFKLMLVEPLVLVKLQERHQGTERWKKNNLVIESGCSRFFCDICSPSNFALNIFRTLSTLDSFYLLPCCVHIIRDFDKWGQFCLIVYKTAIIAPQLLFKVAHCPIYLPDIDNFIDLSTTATPKRAGPQNFYFVFHMSVSAWVLLLCVCLSVV